MKKISYFIIVLGGVVIGWSIVLISKVEPNRHIWPLHEAKLNNPRAQSISDIETPASHNQVEDQSQQVLPSETLWYTVIASPAAVVDVQAYDGTGHHTGRAPNPDPESQFPFFEQQITNSSIERFGGDFYLALYSTGTYIIKVQGLKEGKATLEIILGLSGNKAAPRLRYDLGTVTASFGATLRLVPDMDMRALPELLIDSNGDGKLDAGQKPLLISSS